MFLSSFGPGREDRRFYGRQGVPAYVVGKDKIWRLTPDGKGGAKVDTFDRWAPNEQ